MPRKGENIRKRKDGRWEGRYKKGFDVDKKKTKYQSVYGSTYKEVKDKMNYHKYSHQANHEVSSSSLFGSIVAEWFEHQKSTLKISSQNKYMEIIQNHIISELGHYKISELTKSIISEFLITQKQTGNLKNNGVLSDSMMKTMSYIIKTSLAYCNKEQISFTNIHMKSSSPKIEILSSNEQKKLDYYFATTIEKKNLGIMLGLYCGLRIGEICALRWRDFDMTEKTLSVTKTVQRIKNSSNTSSAKTILYIGEPKSISSNRLIPLPEFLVNCIENHYLPQENSDVFILNSSAERPMDPRTLQYHFKKVLLLNDIADSNFHILRHTFATECINMGFDVKSLSQILGHSSVNITLNRYVHPSLDKKKELMQGWNIKGQIYGQKQ